MNLEVYMDRIHIAGKDVLCISACVAVGVDEAVDDWIVITALEVIPASFCVVTATAIAD